MNVLQRNCSIGQIYTFLVCFLVTLPVWQAHGQGAEVRPADSSPTYAEAHIRGHDETRGTAILSATLFLLVVDQVTGLPIPAVEAVLLSNSDEEIEFVGQEEGGYITFVAIPYDDYTLMLNAEEYDPLTVQIEIEVGTLIREEVRRVLPMMPKSGGPGPGMQLYITILDEITGVPLTNPEIRITPPVSAIPIEVKVGVYAYLGVDIQEYDIMVSAAGYDDKLFRLTNPNLFADVVIELTPANVLTSLNCNGSKTLVLGNLHNAFADLFVLGLSLVSLTAIGRVGDSSKPHP